MNVIRPEDFSQRVTDVNRHTWTAANLEHVVAALEEREVLVETDKQTGHMQRGRLTGYTTSGLSGGAGARLRVTDEHGTTAFLIFKIGVIVDLGVDGEFASANAKWEALRLKRQAEARALGMAREHEDIPFEGSFETYGLGHGEYVVRHIPSGARSWEGTSYRVNLGRDSVVSAY